MLLPLIFDINQVAQPKVSHQILIFSVNLDVQITEGEFTVILNAKTTHPILISSFISKISFDSPILETLNFEKKKYAKKFDTNYVCSLCYFPPPA